MMNKLNVLAIDPSLSGTGISFSDFEEGFFVTSSWRAKPYEKTFIGVYERILEVKQFVFDFAMGLIPDIIVMEHALPRGQWAAGLFGLSTALLVELERHFESAIVLFNPSYLGFIHGTRNYKKSWSVKLAKAILEIEGLKGEMWINHDEAESIILGYAACIQLGLEPKCNHEKFKVSKGQVYRKRSTCSLFDPVQY